MDYRDKHPSIERGSRFNRRNRAKWVRIQPALTTRLPVLLGRQDLMISFVLEEGAAGSADALRVVQLLRKQPETRDFAAMIGDVAFRPKKAYPGLQTSDGLAFGALKLMPTAPPMIDLPENVTLQTIRKTVEWKPPVYHCRLDRSHLAPLKSDILSLVEIRRRIADDHKKR